MEIDAVQLSGPPRPAPHLYRLLTFLLSTGEAAECGRPHRLPLRVPRPQRRHHGETNINIVSAIIVIRDV